MENKGMRRSKTWLGWECAALFVALPCVVFPLPLKGGLFLLLWGMALAALLSWIRMTGGALRELCDFRAIPSAAWRPLLLRFAVCAPLLAGFVAVYDPARLFEFPQTRTGVWAAVMVLYPLLSVIPQEIIYRLFFFERYKLLFVSPRAMAVASGLAFGHGHLLFGNWVAYVFSIVGGVMFAQTYGKYRSFALVWAEHALYGGWVFTVGLGWYFYHGAVR